MKKLLLATGLTVAAFSAVHSQEVVAQTGDNCAPIKDETFSGDTNTRLSNVINKLAEEDIRARVQIYEHSQEEGIRTQADTDRYGRKIVQLCSPGEPAINLVISEDPRVAALYRNDEVASEITQSEADRALLDLRDDLRDPSTSYQSDAANLFEALDPNPVQQTDGVPVSESNHPEDKPLDIPFALVGEVLGTAVLVGGLGARGLKAVSLKREHQSLTGDIKSVKVDLLDNSTKAAAQLSILPADDAPELRQGVETANNSMVEVVSAGENLDEAYKLQRKRLWPDNYALKSALSQSDGDVITRARAVVDDLLVESKRVEDFVANMDEIIAKFDQKIQQLELLISQMQSDGWNVGHFADDLATYKTLQEEVKILRSSNHIEKPAEIMDANDSKIEQSRIDLQAMPERRKAVDADCSKMLETIKSRQGSQSMSNETLSIMKTKYDKSCYEDIQTFERQMDMWLGRMSEIQVASQSVTGKNTIEAVEATEALSAEFEELSGKVISAFEQIHARNAQIEGIIESLPSLISSTRDSISETDSFITHNSNDVEDDTKHALDELNRTLAEFEREEVDVDKPKYLVLDEKINRLKSKASELDRRANAEKQEMDDLRSDLTQGEREVDSDIREFKSYVSTHSSYLTSSRSFSRISVDINDDRQGLRSQVSEINRLKSEISAAKSAAETEVRQAKQREADERAAEAAAERARQASAMSTIISSSTSSNGGGGGNSSIGW